MTPSPFDDSATTFILQNVDLSLVQQVKERRQFPATFSTVGTVGRRHDSLSSLALRAASSVSLGNQSGVSHLSRCVQDTILAGDQWLEMSLELLERVKAVIITTT